MPDFLQFQSPNLDKPEPKYNKWCWLLVAGAVQDANQQLATSNQQQNQMFISENILPKKVRILGVMY